MSLIDFYQAFMQLDLKLTFEYILLTKFFANSIFLNSIRAQNKIIKFCSRTAPLQYPFYRSKLLSSTIGQAFCETKDVTVLQNKVYVEQCIVWLRDEICVLGDAERNLWLCVPHRHT